MKKYIFKSLFFLPLMFFTIGCESPLEEEVLSELAPGNFLLLEEGIMAVLNSGYGNAQARSIEAYNKVSFSGFPAGECWGRGGSIEALLTPLTNFTWDSNHRRFNDEWLLNYAAIRDANIILENIENGDFSDQFKSEISAEAKFLRGFGYYVINDLFGTGPIFTSTTEEELKKPKASEAEIVNQIESDLIDAAAGLPLTQSLYGRATKGSALGVLTKLYLNTKQWQKAADAAQQVIALNQYGLFPNYLDLFRNSQEGNEEIIWTHASSSAAGGNFLNALVYPPDFPRGASQGVFAARTYFYDAFLDGYEEGDTRKEMFVTEYVSSSSGETIPGYGVDQSFPGKYEFAPDQAGAASGTDVPEVRYADILLSRAEALNELSGPSQEAMDLINLVRTRAGISALEASAFSKESLRDHLLQERAWEFAFEGKAREDQKRQDVFISAAQARGTSAQAHHRVFPIPQREMDSNPNIEQNSGY